MSSLELFRSMILQLILLSAPMLLVSMGVGLIVSVFQATTSIQEQTLSFAPKMVVILLTLLYFWPWLESSLGQFTVALFNQIHAMSG